MKHHVNYYFLILFFCLLSSGLLFLSTLSAISSLQVFGNTNHYLFHQLAAAGIGLILGLIAFKLPLPFIKKIAPILFFLNFIAVVAVFLPVIGTKLQGAQRWISIGNNAFQPSEFLKISAILYASAWLSNKTSNSSKKNLIMAVKKNFESFRTIFLPFTIFLCMIGVVLVLQRDLSTLGIISVALVTIFFIAETPLWHTLLAFFGGASALAVLIIIKPYRFQRILTFLDPSKDILGIGHQVNQSKLAIGSGGFFGKGLGMSVQKFGFLPEAMSDSIFAIVGEELGLIGCTILIGAFSLFLYLGFKIAKACTDKFGQLAAVGLSTWIVFQAFINIAAAIGLFPLAGIPLPFFSYGGSHVVSEIIAVGLLLNISKNG